MIKSFLCKHLWENKYLRENQKSGGKDSEDVLLQTPTLAELPGPALWPLGQRIYPFYHFSFFLGPKADTGALDFPCFRGPVTKSWVSFWGAGSGMVMPSKSRQGTQLESGATSRAGQLSLLLSQRGLNAHDQRASFLRLLKLERAQPSFGERIFYT